MKKKILIVEDEKDIREMLIVAFKRDQYEVFEAESAEDALLIFNREKEIYIVLIDIMLPGMDGFSLCEKIRETNPFVGLMFLTAKNQEQDKIRGLRSGADDYVVKPFSVKELLMRTEALRRRVIQYKKEKYSMVLGPFELDENSHQFKKEGKEIHLSQTEYKLVAYFMQYPNQILSRNQLLDAVWGENYFGPSKVVDVNIQRIRRKIDDEAHEVIETIWGVGYKWRNQDTENL